MTVKKNHKVTKAFSIISSLAKKLPVKKSGKTKPKTKQKLHIRILKWTGYTIGCILLYFVLVNFNFLWLFGSSPNIDKDKNPDISLSSELYSADGVLMGKYYKENRSPVKYNEIPKNIINALVATEDARFFEHSGIDLRATLSVFWYIMKGDNRGGSTISQQLAKNLFKTRRSSKGLLGYIPGLKIIIAKTKEWITAVKLEAKYSKEDILTMYLNTVDFGNNAFGVKVAASTYFNKSQLDLKQEESALLIGILKAPTYYSPTSKPEKAIERRNLVLSQMNKYNYLNKQQTDSLSKIPVELDFSIENPDNFGMGDYVRGAVANFLKEWCKRTKHDIYRDGLKIYTSIDSKMQQYAEEAVEQNMKRLQKRFNEHWEKKNPWIDGHNEEIPNFIEDYVKTTPLYKKLKVRYKKNLDSIEIALNEPKRMRVFTWKGDKDTTFSSMDSIKYYKRFLNAGFIVMDPYKGQIKAWVGGINYKHFRYDHIYQAKRQPGSTFKPFVYLTAIDNGYTPCDRIEDKRVTIKYVEDGVAKEWTPHNANGEYSGRNMTLRHAMGKSCNSVTVQLTELVGPEKVAEYAQKLGIKSRLKPVPSIGLGSNDVSLYEMIGAYSTFMNKGVWTEPMLVTKIYDRDGKLIEEFRPNRKKVISEETAFLMAYMLKGGIEEPEGTSQSLWEYDIFQKNEIGGKTGTSSNYSDGWFVGITKDLVGASWVGGEDRSIHFRSTAKQEGCHTALPIFGIFLTKVYDDESLGITKGKFPKPSTKIKKKYYCPTPRGSKHRDEDEEEISIEDI